MAKAQIYIEPRGYYDYLQREKSTKYRTYEDFLSACKATGRLSGTPSTLVLGHDDLRPQNIETFLEAFDKYNGPPPWMLPSLPGKNTQTRTARQKIEDAVKICNALGELAFLNTPVDENGSRESYIRRHDLALQ